MPDLFGRAAREFFALLQFFVGVLRLWFEQAADVIRTHGDGRDTLGRPVVQIAGELLAGVLFDFDDALFFFPDVLVEDRVLKGDSRLRADSRQQFDVLIREGVWLGR